MSRIEHYISALRSQKRPFRFLLSRLLWYTGWSRLLSIDRGLYRMCFFPTALSATCWTASDDREEDGPFFASYLKRGDIVIDVGANIGTYTLTAAAIVGDSGTVFSFEPHPVIFKYLQKNVALNSFKNVHLFNIAVGDAKGAVSISDSRLDDQNEILMTDKGIRVPIERLDKLLIDKINESLSVALLKVDVEGYERFVFQGASRILKKCECIYFESWEKHYAKYNYITTDILELLISNGFLIYKVINGEIVKLPINYRSEVCENLMAIKNLLNFKSRVSEGQLHSMV